MKLISALVLTVIAVSLSMTPAFAQERKDGSLTVSPAYLEVSLTKPGEEQRISISYTNHSTTPITLEMFPLDFNHTDANGTIGFLSQPSGSYSYSLASYLSLSANQVQIDPKESAVFPVVVKNRPDLTPGGHYGAIIAKVISGDADQVGAQVSPSLSTLIFLRKTGGERYNLSLRQTDDGGSLYFTYPKTLMLEFQNEGNIHLVPYGTVEIKDMFGRTLKKGNLNSSSFLVMPESRRNVSVTLHSVSQSFPISFNTLTVKGNDSLKKTTFLYRNSSLYITPFLPPILLLLLAAGIWIKRKKKLKDNKVVHKDDNKPRKRA